MNHHDQELTIALHMRPLKKREEQEKLRQDLIARYGFDVLAAERKEFGKSITTMIDLAKQDHERRRKQEQERQQES